MAASSRSQKSQKSGTGAAQLADAMRACRGAFVSVGITSGFINILMLSGAIYMLEVYDRVLTSRSIPTLIGLTVLVAGLYLFQGVLDIIRNRILIRIGSALDESLSGRVYEALIRMPLRTRVSGDGIQPLRDLDQVRGYSSGPGLSALFDLPWMPVYIFVCFLFHPLIGVGALAGAAILVTLTIVAEVTSRKAITDAAQLGAQRNALAEASRRNAEVVHAMGMSGRLASQWSDSNARYMATQRRVSDISSTFGSISKVARMALQSAILGLGAYLVIQQEATAGIIIASSIITSRALAPIEQVIGNWRGFTAARQGWRRLSELLQLMATQDAPMSLPPAEKSLDVSNVTVIPPGGRLAVVHDVSFSLKAGDALGIIGPSASGKSSLARALVGIWPAARGNVRLDGATQDQWSQDDLGRNVGYLPQDVELFAGTIAQNISRFDEQATPDSVIHAARIADVHNLVLKHSQGYDTEIGEGGMVLSAGQRQRIALARAVFGDPFLVVLDEPNSNLDAEGDKALTKAVMSIRNRGGIAIVVAHRPTALVAANLVMVMGEGRLQDFGSKDEVMKRLLGQDQNGPQPSLRVVPEKG